MAEHKRNWFDLIIKWSPLILMIAGMIGGYFTMKFTLESDHETLIDHDAKIDSFDERISRLEGEIDSLKRRN